MNQEKAYYDVVAEGAKIYGNDYYGEKKLMDAKDWIDTCTGPFLCCYTNSCIYVVPLQNQSLGDTKYDLNTLYAIEKDMYKTPKTAIYLYDGKNLSKSSFADAKKLLDKNIKALEGLSDNLGFQSIAAESVKVDLPKHYKNDLNVIDRESLRGYDGKFVYILRDAGTQLCKLENQTKGYYRTEKTTFEYHKDKSSAKFYIFDGKKLKKASADKCIKLIDNAARGKDSQKTVGFGR